jgi:cell division protein FtsN
MGGTDDRQGQVMKQQWGGTILGLIVGIVIGLAVALAVAVYVTKVPVPFLNKGPSRTVDQDAAEARRNKDWDPNAPLYGKNPARAAVPAASDAGAAGADYKAVPPAVAGIPTPGPAATPSADPLGDLARARAGTDGAVDPFTYFVQVGAYRTANDAESQRARLSLGGIEARVSEREQSGRTVYRVRVGPFDKRGDAELTKEKLESLGMEAALVRVQR